MVDTIKSFIYLNNLRSVLKLLLSLCIFAITGCKRGV